MAPRGTTGKGRLRLIAGGRQGCHGQGASALARAAMFRPGRTNAALLVYPKPGTGKPWRACPWHPGVLPERAGIGSMRRDGKGATDKGRQPLPVRGCCVRQDQCDTSCVLETRHGQTLAGLTVAPVWWVGVETGFPFGRCRARCQTGAWDFLSEPKAARSRTGPPSVSTKWSQAPSLYHVDLAPCCRHVAGRKTRPPDRGRSCLRQGALRASPGAATLRRAPRPAERGRHRRYGGASQAGRLCYPGVAWE